MILQLRDLQMRAEHAGGHGKSIPELAGLYGLTTRHVLNILAKGASGEDASHHQVEQLQLL
jgi:Mor family transcriptional regulator